MRMPQLTKKDYFSLKLKMLPYAHISTHATYIDIYVVVDELNKPATPYDPASHTSPVP